MQYVILADRFALAVVLGAACAAKLRTLSIFRRFANSIERLARLPPVPALVIAGTVVLAEGAASVLLVLPWTGRLGLMLAGGLMLMFVAVVIRGAAAGGLVAECRCFGGPAVMGLTMVFRNVVLFAAALAGLVLGPAGPAGHPGYAAVAIVAGCGAAAAFMRYYGPLLKLVTRRIIRPAAQGASTGPRPAEPGSR